MLQHTMGLAAHRDKLLGVVGVKAGTRSRLASTTATTGAVCAGRAAAVSGISESLSVIATTVRGGPAVRDLPRSFLHGMCPLLPHDESQQAAFMGFVGKRGTAVGVP